MACVSVGSGGRMERHDVEGAKIGDWVVVLELDADDRDRPFELTTVQLLLERLREWHPTGLYSPDRYALQLHIAASSADEALQLASSYHEHATRDMGGTWTFTRAEVVTLHEFESNWNAPVPPDGSGEGRPDEATTSVDAYEATRALLDASTESEVADILVAFVTAVGGRVKIGDRRADPAVISIDLQISENGPVCAVAENFSVAGMLLARWLPPLLEDARHVAALLQQPG